MKYLIYYILLFCSLIFSGCFSSPSDKNGDGQEELHMIWMEVHHLQTH